MVSKFAGCSFITLITIKSLVIYKKADEVSNLAEPIWFARYPWPESITYDGGPEFKKEFGDLLRNEYPNIKRKPSSKRNPQSNAILERVHGTIGNMIFPIQYVVDWQHIRNRKQRLISKNNAKENKKRVEHDYKIGERVLIFSSDPNKMEQPRRGPYDIIQVQTNGTVTLQKDNVTERYNVRQIVPFLE